MTEPTTPTTDGPGLLSRIIGVITSPGATFEKIVQVPKPMGVLFFVALVTAVVVGVFFGSEVGKTAWLDQMATANPDMTPEQMQGFQRVLPYMGYMSAGGAFIWVPIFSMLCAAVLWAVFNVGMGGGATFKQVLNVIAHSQVISVLGSFVTFPLNYARGTMTSATNLSVLMPSIDEGSFLAKFLGAMDLFLLWWVVVLGIGMATLYKRKAGGIVTGLLVFYVAIAACIAFFTAR